MHKLLKEEQGTAAIEYSLIISLVGLVIVGVIHILGANLLETFSSINEELPSLIVTEDHSKSRLLGEL